MDSPKATMELVVDEPTQLDEGKRQCILEGPTRTFPGNASTTEYFEVLLEDSANQSKVALIDEGRQSTFDELNKTSSKIATTLQSIVREKNLKNFNPHNDWVIGLCLPPSDKLIFCIFAIHKLGGAYVPIDHTFPENRVTSMVANCRPIIIISDSLPSTLSKFDIVADQSEIVNVDELLERSMKSGLVKVTPFSSKIKSLTERIALVLYTSGSSGTPKGVRLTHRTIMNRLSWQWETFPYVSDESCCFKTALTFVDSVSEIFGPLLRGFAINIFSKLTVSNPNLLIKKIYLCQISRIVLVPSLLRALLSSLRLLDVEEEKGSEKLNCIRLWVSSGETLHKELVDDFFQQFSTNQTTLCNFYGSTEIMGDVSYECFHSAEDVLKQIDGIQIPIGAAIFNTMLYIVTDQLKLTPEGEVGELYVAGHNVCSGYVGIDHSDKFIDNPFTTSLGFNRLFRTGDFVRIYNKYGRRTLMYEGRSDSQIKVRGHRVDLNEIETILNSQSDLIGRATVLCYNPGKDDQAIVAFIIPANFKEVSIEAISEVVKGSLKSYEVPDLRLIPEVPLLINGKIDRQRLLTLFETERNRHGEMCGDTWHMVNVPHEMMTQARALVEAISDVTHLPPIEIVNNFDDSFFNVGGNSLNCVTVVTTLRAKNFHIGLDDFVSAKTIREMIPLVASTLPNKPGTINTGGGKRHQKYYSEFLAAMHEIDTSEIIANSFSRKGDLEVYTNSTYQDFKELIRFLYPTLQKKALSFIVRRREDKKAVAVALNFDFYDEPEHIPGAPGLQTIFEFLEFIESKHREKLPKGRKKIFHSFMMGTHELITEAENVPLITFMEDEITRIAKDKKFLGVLTTNTNPLTKQVCTDIFGYETLIEYQINQYVDSEGSRPFRLAPDNETVICCWKQLEQPKETTPFPNSQSRVTLKDKN